MGVDTDILINLAIISLCVRGVVALSSIFVRQGADYTSSLETQELMGREVEILESDRYWLKINTSQSQGGWATDMGIVVLDSCALRQYRNAEKYIFTALSGAAVEYARKDSPQLCDLVAGDILRVRKDHRGGDVRKGGFAGVVLPDGRCGWVRSECLEKYDRWERDKAALTSRKKAEKIVGFARSLTGVPYLWGGMTVHALDCSGLARLSYLMVGIQLPRNTSQQIKCGRAVDAGDMGSWKAGDLIFFGNKSTGRPSHVGIYLGSGRMIHSSMCVRVNSLREEDEDYYSNASRLIAVRRVLE